MAQTPSQLLPARLPQIAIVGSYLGRARYGAALASLPSVKVIGIVDPDSRSGRGWARELAGKPAVYNSVERLLEAEPDLDGVIIACALAERSSAIEYFAASGVPVLSEFPYTKTLTEMDRLTGIAAASHSHIMQAFTHRYSPSVLELDRILATDGAGLLSRVRCEVSFPLGASYALENGVVPVSIDWYDLLQVVACRTLDFCGKWLGKPLSINADIDLPHHAALVGRRASDPVANLIVTHERGQSTHLLQLSRSVQPTERYLLYGERGSIELVLSEGEKLNVGPFVRLSLTGTKPEFVYSAENSAAELSAASANLVADFVNVVECITSVKQSTNEARTALEAVHAAFASARDGIRTSLPLLQQVNVDGILEGGTVRN